MGTRTFARTWNSFVKAIMGVCVGLVVCGGLVLPAAEEVAAAGTASRGVVLSLETSEL